MKMKNFRGQGFSRDAGNEHRLGNKSVRVKLGSTQTFSEVRKNRARAHGWWEGFGSLLNIYPARVKVKRVKPTPNPFVSDREALCFDWEIIGKDLYNALAGAGGAKPRNGK